MKISEHFDAREFIDPVTWSELGEKAIEKLDKKIPPIVELLRSKTGNKGVVINNYHVGGQYKESGTRRMETKTGAAKSAHKMNPICRAVDCKVVGMTAAQVWEIILNNEKEFYDMGVRQMEDISFTPTWIHLATRGADNPQHKIQIIKQ